MYNSTKPRVDDEDDVDDLDDVLDKFTPSKASASQLSTSSPAVHEPTSSQASKQKSSSSNADFGADLRNHLLKKWRLFDAVLHDKKWVKV